MRSHDLERLLDFDPAEAALRSGAARPQRLANTLAREHSRRLRALLEEFEDSYLGQGIDSFYELAVSLGFQDLQQEEFWSGGPALFLAMEKDGMLLVYDSYQGMVNQARLLVRSRRQIKGGEPHGRLFRAALDVRSGLKARLAPHLLPTNIQADCKLLPSDLRERLDAKRWPRRSRKALGAK